MWTCERIKRTKFGFVTCDERKNFRTLYEAKAYATECIRVIKDDKFMCNMFYMYQIKKLHGKSKVHFVTRAGTWYE